MDECSTGVNNLGRATLIFTTEGALLKTNETGKNVVGGRHHFRLDGPHQLGGGLDRTRMTPTRIIRWLKLFHRFNRKRIRLSFIVLAMVVLLLYMFQSTPLDSIVVKTVTFNSIDDSTYGARNVSLPEDESNQFRPGRIPELCKEDVGGNKRIFFIETSGEECLRPRQACAIESAALTNPDMAVYVHMAKDKPPGTPEVDRGEGLERHCQTMDILKSYPNIYFVRENLTKHLEGTLLNSIYISGSMNQSEYAFQHLSDIVRIALLYKKGGIYLDMDVVVLRSLRCLRNTAGHVLDLEGSSVENGVLAFDRNHRFLKYLMFVMKSMYEPQSRMSIGPYALTDTFRLMCKHSSKIIDDSKFDYNCPTDRVRIRLLNSTSFYPFNYLHRHWLFSHEFEKDSPNQLLDRFATTYAIHFYTAGHGTRVPKGSFYAFTARHFCPSIYRQQEFDSSYLF